MFSALWLLLYSEDVGSILLRNVCEFVLHYTALRREDSNFLFHRSSRSTASTPLLCAVITSGLVPRIVSYGTISVISRRSLYSGAGIIRPEMIIRTRLTSGGEKVCKTTDEAALHESDKMTSRGRPLTYYVASVRGQGKRCCIVNIQKKVELKGWGGG
jgi:hypothetical protein